MWEDVFHPHCGSLPKKLVKLLSAFECDEVSLDGKSPKLGRSIFCELNSIETLVNESCIDG